MTDFAEQVIVLFENGEALAFPEPARVAETLNGFAWWIFAAAAAEMGRVALIPPTIVVLARHGSGQFEKGTLMIPLWLGI